MSPFHLMSPSLLISILRVRWAKVCKLFCQILCVSDASFGFLSASVAALSCPTWGLCYLAQHGDCVHLHDCCSTVLIPHWDSWSAESKGQPEKSWDLRTDLSTRPRLSHPRVGIQLPCLVSNAQEPRSTTAEFVLSSSLCFSDEVRRVPFCTVPEEATGRMDT